jgi:hypothetical protein
MTCFSAESRACVQMLCGLVIGRIVRGEARGFRVQYLHACIRGGQADEVCFFVS